MRPNGHTVRRLKKILWHFYVPAFVENHGVLLPTKHDLISDGIRRQIKVPPQIASRFGQGKRPLVEESQALILPETLVVQPRA